MITNKIFHVFPIFSDFTNFTYGITVLYSVQYPRYHIYIYSLGLKIVPDIVLIDYYLRLLFKILCRMSFMFRKCHMILGYCPKCHTRSQKSASVSKRFVLDVTFQTVQTTG